MNILRFNGVNYNSCGINFNQNRLSATQKSNDIQNQPSFGLMGKNRFFRGNRANYDRFRGHLSAKVIAKVIGFPTATLVLANALRTMLGWVEW